MIKETQPARQRYVKNGVDYPYISSSVRGKDLKKKRRHVNDKRTRWMSISSDLSFIDNIPLIIDGNKIHIKVEDAIKSYPEKLYNEVSNRKSKYFVNKTVYKKLIEEIQENHPQLYLTIELAKRSKKFKKKASQFKPSDSKLRAPEIQKDQYGIDQYTGTRIKRLFN